MPPRKKADWMHGQRQAAMPSLGCLFGDAPSTTSLVSGRTLPVYELPRSTSLPAVGFVSVSIASRQIWGKYAWSSGLRVRRPNQAAEVDCETVRTKLLQCLSTEERIERQRGTVFCIYITHSSFGELASAWARQGRAVSLRFFGREPRRATPIQSLPLARVLLCAAAACSLLQPAPGTGPQW